MIVITEIKFKKGDIHFEPVLGFFSSYITYHYIFAKQWHDEVEGRLRGVVIPQLKYDTDFPRQLKNREDVSELQFQLDLTVPDKPEGELLKTSFFSRFWLQQMVGQAYESSFDQMESKFGTDRMSWPPIFQFFRHVRNGCFHNNIFKIKQGSISTQQKTEWRGKEITYNENGNQVIFGFLGMCDPIVLLHDIQNELQ